MRLTRQQVDELLKEYELKGADSCSHDLFMQALHDWAEFDDRLHELQQQDWERRLAEKEGEK